MARSTISEDQLLKTRLCDLRLSVSASPKLSSAVAQIQSELQLKGVHFTPTFGYPPIGSAQIVARGSLFHFTLQTPSC